MDREQFQKIWKAVQDKPSIFKRHLNRHELTPEDFDKLVVEYDWDHAQELAAFCEKYRVKYGVYPQNNSVVPLKVLAEACQIPKTVAALAAQTVGTAPEILTACRVRVIQFSDTYFSDIHLINEYDLDAKELDEALDLHAFKHTVAINSLTKKVQKDYENMVKATQKSLKEISKSNYKKQQAALDGESETGDAENIDPDLETV